MYGVYVHMEYGFEPCLLKNAERSLRYHVKRELPKQKNCERTNGVITHYVMNFDDYILRCFYHPQWCFISIDSVDTRTLLE
mgnify:CR=1 FL=1